MIRQLIQLTLALLLLLSVVISCKKTENDIIRAPSLNCSAIALSNNTFLNNGSPQSATLTVGLNDAIRGNVTFTIVSTAPDFSPATYTTSVNDEQTAVAIPIMFDGTSGLTSATISVAAGSYASGTCSVTASISSGTSTTTTPDCSSANTTTAHVVCAANAFLATLTDSQKSVVLQNYTQGNATKWSALACGSDCRSGLPLSSLTNPQLTAALAVVAAATGTSTNEGNDEITQIRAAADVLNKANPGSGTYSSGAYFIAFLGTPSTTGTWQLQFSGYNLAINRTYKDGTVQGSTPQFDGIEPTSWTTVTGSLYAPLATEHDAMAALLTLFNSGQLATAKLDLAVSDLLLGAGNDGKFPAAKAGIKVSSLTTDQQTLVLAAIKPWVQDSDDATATSLLAIYQKELADTYIAYSGNPSLTSKADYVRIDGPSVWIEFICKSGSVLSSQIQYQSVWRDRSRDYGGNFTF